MAKHKLRNPDLYKRLCDLYGQANVQIHDPGVKGDIQRDFIDGRADRFKFVNPSHVRGEQYSICCPICNDHEPRCYVHHLFATPDEVSEHGYIRLWHCFNEECQSEFENRIRFLDEIVGNSSLNSFRVDEEVDVPAETYVPSWPGMMMSITEMVRFNPQHPMLRYCLKRNYDVANLARHGVCFCVSGDNKHPHVTGRMVVPFLRYKDEKKFEMLGWTARLIDKPPRNAEGAFASKWVHSKAPTGGIVYGLSGAADSLVTVIVEGPGDKWTIGKPAAAILSKKLTAQKAAVIAKALRKRPDPRRVVVLAMDPNKSPDAIRRGAPHHIDEAFEVMEAATEYPVVKCFMPQETDPGMLFRKFALSQIEAAVIAAGFKCEW